MLQEHPVVMLMLSASTLKDPTTAAVMLVIRETEKHVKVKFVVFKTARS